MSRTGVTHRSPGKAALMVLALAVVLLVPMSPTFAGTTPSASAKAVDPSRKPSIVLVHGAWADASSWNGVIPLLQRDGYTVLAPPNPLRSLSGDAASLRAFLATIPGPIVLVGHSYGGAVITNAATDNANVKALVYVDAFAPDQGEIINGLVGVGSALAGDPSTLFDVRPYSGAPAGDADVYLKPNVVIADFAQDIPRRQAAVLATTQRPITFVAGNEPSGTPAWRTIPSWYLLGTHDLIITPEAQKAMAKRAGSRIAHVNSSHVSLISHPGAVAGLIRAADRATR